MKTKTFLKTCQNSRFFGGFTLLSLLCVQFFRDFKPPFSPPHPPGGETNLAIFHAPLVRDTRLLPERLKAGKDWKVW